MRQLLTIESAFPQEHSILRFLEPPGSCVRSIWTRLVEGTYDKPFILDSGLRRFLHFDLDAVQSAMDMCDPIRLTLAYTRRMMAFLLFNRAPARVLLLGLGGGSLAKFCYHRLPKAAVTTVELNADVIALRDEFRVPANDARFRIIHADGATYVAQLSPCKDVILADACDRVGIAPELDTIAFYDNIRRSLTSEGIFVTNVCGDRFSKSAHLMKIRRVFGDEIVTLPVRPDGNVIVLAFKQRCPEIRIEQLADCAADLQREFGLNLPRYVQRIALDLQLRSWERSLPRL